MVKNGLENFQNLASGVNGYRFDFDPSILHELQITYQNQLAPFFESPENQALLEGVYYQSQILEPGNFYLVSYDTYPLLWLTNHNLVTYQIFRRFFKHLNLDAHLINHLNFDKQLVMYSGFYVVGNRALEKMWHYDYRPGAQAMTLIAPLFEWHPEHGHLLYQDAQAQEQQYTYQLGQAIIFGAGFYHSTMPYPKTDKLRVLVSFTFGSDQWETWEIIQQNIAEQSYFYVQPCGHPVQSCNCYARWQNKQKPWGWLNRQKHPKEK